MLKSEWSLQIGVAGEADRVLRRRCAQLPSEEAPVWVVAVGAADQPFVDFVVGGAIEVGADVLMAGVAQLRLRDFQQPLLYCGLVGRMAIDAAYVIGGVRRPGCVRPTSCTLF